MLSRFKTSHKLAIGFSLLIGLLLAIGTFNIFSTQQFSKLINEIHSLRITAITLIDEANLYAIYHNRTIYSLAAEQDPEIVDDILREMADYQTQMETRLEEYSRIPLSEQETALLAEIHRYWPEYTANIVHIADRARRGDTGNAMTMTQGAVQNVFRLIEKNFSEIVKLNKERARQAQEEGHSLARRILQFTTAGMLISIALGILIALAVTRNIVTPLTQAVTELNRIALGDMTSAITVSGNDEASHMMRSLGVVQSELSKIVAKLQSTASYMHEAVTEVSASTGQLTISAAESSKKMTTTASSLEQLTQSVEQVGNNADQASSLASEARNAAKKGMQLGNLASQDAREASQRVAETGDMIQRLSAEIGQIGFIANLIKDVADQTNLLALNAAIEAARAGEQGRGFAVVADEVRKLAERTTTSAQQINDMINAIKNETESVVVSMSLSQKTMDGVREKVSQTTSAIAQIEDRVSSAVAAVAEISSALRDQKNTSSDIAQNTENVARFSEANAREAETVSRAMAEVQALAEELGAMTQHFRVSQ